MALQLPVKIVLNIGRTKNAVRVGLLPGGGGGAGAPPPMKGVGMLVGNFELNP